MAKKPAKSSKVAMSPRPRVKKTPPKAPKKPSAPKKGRKTYPC